MKNLKLFGSGIVAVLFAFYSPQKAPVDALKEEIKPVEKVALTPPMGWNSFDAYYCRINEEQFHSIANYMAGNLLEYCWGYAVIDYIWWHPEPGNWNTPRRKGHPNIHYKTPGEPLSPDYYPKWTNSTIYNYEEDAFF